MQEKVHFSILDWEKMHLNIFPHARTYKTTKKVKTFSKWVSKNKFETCYGQIKKLDTLYVFKKSPIQMVWNLNTNSLLCNLKYTRPPLTVQSGRHVFILVVWTRCKYVSGFFWLEKTPGNTFRTIWAPEIDFFFSRSCLMALSEAQVEIPAYSHADKWFSKGFENDQ